MDGVLKTVLHICNEISKPVAAKQAGTVNARINKLFSFIMFLAVQVLAAVTEKSVHVFGRFPWQASQRVPRVLDRRSPSEFKFVFNMSALSLLVFPILSIIPIVLSTKVRENLIAFINFQEVHLSGSHY
jgi:hypothetical protein